MNTRLQRGTRHRQERGYILLTLMLAVTVLIIMMGLAVQEIKFQVQRDREEEMIHRGVQYSRAIRKYVKKFGRYPTRIEDLESTNNIRFLRRRYKDPITGKDFKLLHIGEVQLMPGAGIAGAIPASALPGGLGQQQTPTNNQSGQTGDTNQNGQAQGNQSSSDSSNLTSQTLGGGPIVGVVSTSKEESIRVFNNKNHYNQWQFIYDPNTDRGGLLNTPAQPALQGAVPTGQPPTNDTRPMGPSQGPPTSAPPSTPPDQPPPSDPRMDN